MKLRFNYFKTIFLIAVFSIVCHQPLAAAPLELTLDECIELALKNNPAPQIAEAYKEQAAWAVKSAQGGKGLSINFTHTDLRSTEPHAWMQTLAATSPYNYYSNQIAATIPLYTGGKLENTIAQAKLGLKVSELDIKAVKQQIKLEATIGYYNVLQTQNLLEIAGQTVEDFSAHLGRVQQMFKAGTVAWHDVLQTKVKLANAENNYVQAQNNYNLAVYNLNKTMGLPLHSEVKLKESLTYQQYPSAFDEVIAYGLANRPELAQREAQIKMAQAQTKIARSGHLPTISLSGSTAWDDTDFAGTKNRDWKAMLVTQFNLFDSGTTKANIKQAKSQVVAAEKQERQTRDNISLEISDAYLSMKEAEKRIATNQATVEEATESFKIAQRRYSAGVGTNLDVMDAELSLNQAKTNYLNSLFDYNASKARLDKAIGVDVES